MRLLPSVRWHLLRTLSGLLTLLLALGSCDRSPDHPKTPALPPAGRRVPAVPGPVVPPRLTRRFDTTTVGTFFGSRKLLRPYRRDAQEFYQGRGGLIGWFRADRTPRPQAYKLLQRIRQAEADGLDPYRYHLTDLERQLRGFAPDSVARTDSLLVLRRQRALDLQLTGTYLLLLGDYALGAVDAGVNGANRWH